MIQEQGLCQNLAWNWDFVAGNWDFVKNHAGNWDLIPPFRTLLQASATGSSKAVLMSGGFCSRPVRKSHGKNMEILLLNLKNTERFIKTGDFIKNWKILV